MMKWMAWAVVRFGFDQRFGVMRTRVDPSRPARQRMVAVEYHQANGKRWETDDRAAAQREADRINGLAAIPQRVTDSQFDAATEHVPMRANTRNALRDIMVRGYTWKQASGRHNITESGILRAMRRVSERNHT